MENFKCDDCEIIKENEELRRHLARGAAVQNKIVDAILRSAGIKANKKACLLPGEKSEYTYNPDIKALNSLRKRIMDFMETVDERTAMKLQAILDGD